MEEIEKELKIRNNLKNFSNKSLNKLVKTNKYLLKKSSLRNIIQNTNWLEENNNQVPNCFKYSGIHKIRKNRLEQSN